MKSSPISVPIRPLCPTFILDQHKAGRSAGYFQALVIDVDTSGFTQVTDALSVHGPQGAEILASIIRAIFEPMTSCVYEYGGFVAHYTGDGFLAAFPETAGLGSTINRGLAAGWEMRQTIRSRHTYQTRFGTFTINARIGIADGRINWRILRDASGHRHIYYFDGTPIVDAAKVRQMVGPGELIATSATAARFSAATVTKSLQGGEARIVEDAENLVAPFQLSPVPETSDRLVTDFYPDVVATAEGYGQFRWTATLFVHLDRPKQELDAFVANLFEAHDLFGGFINGITDGDKGCTALIFWGAPIATEDDVGRAIEFAVHVLEKLGTSVSAGLTYGLSHAGFSGSRRHEVYTCASRHVNLAARLASRAAPGQILLDSSTRDHALGRFHFEFVGNLELKGFSDPQPVYALGARRDVHAQVTTSGDIVERGAQIKELLDAVQAILQSGGGGAAVVTGGAGSGKSTLLSVVHQRLKEKNTAQEMSAVVISLIPETVLERPLGPFQRTLEDVFKLSALRDEEHRRSTFLAEFESLCDQTSDSALREELAFTRSFIAALLNVHWAGSTYAQVGPELRYRNTFRGIIASLRALAGRNPLVLIAENVGTFDTASKEMLDLVSSQSGFPVALLASCRLDDNGNVPDVPFGSASIRAMIRLDSLSPSGVRQIAERALGSPVSQRLVEYLRDKSAGNPLYLEQLILTLSSSGGFLYRGKGLNARVELAPDAVAHLPQGLSGILMARIDRLPGRLKSVIQVAAVLGDEFGAPLLREMLNDDRMIADALEEGQAQQIWTERSPGHYRFRHAMLRNAIYDMQLVVVRRNLHRQAAQTLESLSGEGDLDRMEALAYHFEQGEMPEEAQHYLRKAGDMAHQRLDAPRAIYLYRRLLKYSIELDLQVSISARLGALLALTGDWEEAVQVLEHGLSGILAAEDPRQEIDMLIVLGDVLRQSGDVARARERLELAWAIARRADDQEMVGKSLSMLAGTYKYSGDYYHAQEFYRQSLAVGERLEDQNLIAISLAGIASAHGLLGSYRQAIENNRRAIPILEQLGNKQELAYPIGNLGIDLFTVGEYDEALEVLERALKVSNSIGDRPGVWFANHFIGRVHHECGKLGLAIKAYEQAMRERRVLGGDAIPYETLPHFAAAKASLGADAEAIDALSAHLDMLQGGEADHEHGLTYLGVAKLLRKRSSLTAEARSKLDQLSRRGLGTTGLVWLRKADQSARAGRAMGLGSRIRVLVECASQWIEPGEDQRMAIGCLAAAHQLASDYSLAGERRFVLTAVRDMGLDIEALKRVPALLLPFAKD
ncbi:tetratricopeptide repeat protein [Ruegeria sp. WL0004]|uniref:Tetratricopeptide repeat protein n=1 Tax=Ruegeria marisflavi TaxID=2984152 RepID=A0ABT2WPY3_9RHOB|nr:tetratricopeptide repeat protein [Ruegeria sp. WL0004]MCU9837941.1 tetratricopeptide repeat protein [Ruegeria sp. WL0004]